MRNPGEKEEDQAESAVRHKKGLLSIYEDESPLSDEISREDLRKPKKKGQKQSSARASKDLEEEATRQIGAEQASHGSSHKS